MHPSLGTNPLEVANQQHAEISPRRDAFASFAVGIERGAADFTPGIDSTVEVDPNLWTADGVE
jgi:hypothetical protein